MDLGDVTGDVVLGSKRLCARDTFVTLAEITTSLI